MDYLTEWTFGECDGKKVAVEMVIPIRYSVMSGLMPCPTTTKDQ